MHEKTSGFAGISRGIVDQEGKTIFSTTQDCTPIAEYAKAQHNEGNFGTSDVKHAARIPNVIVEKYCNDHGVTFEQFMGDPVHIKRLVEHPDNSMFRIWRGRL